MSLVLKPLLSVTAEEKAAMSEEQLIAFAEKNAAIQSENFKSMEDYAKAEKEAQDKLKDSMLKQGEIIANLKMNPVNQIDEIKAKKLEAIKAACEEKKTSDVVNFTLSLKFI